MRPEWQQFGFAPWVEPTYRWIRPVLPLLGIYAMVRAGLLVADALAAHLTYGTHPDGPLTAWDGNWYLSVAARGYPALAPTPGGHLTYGAAGFEPVFPALIRVMEAAGFTAIQAALVVSIVAGGGIGDPRVAPGDGDLRRTCGNDRRHSPSCFRAWRSRGE